MKDIVLQEQKAEVRWGKGRKFEHNVAEKSGVREGNDKPGAKKTIPSPTGSSISQDTGFGSQEGEGSIVGSLVTPGMLFHTLHPATAAVGTSLEKDSSLPLNSQ
ncbi:unnamed protein product [Pleuronectes platessa]|uniref:Uncharacterized protein n=1 Tax=Pleuronectes platessa TaxID=8262 RepID=A0A9N7TZN9_PLEPL|nr:unnamed protein product [Pleuronectes platessa]